MLLEQDKQRKAHEVLNKLLNAALKAQQEGKYIALQKIIFEANKVSAHLNRIMEATPNARENLYVSVRGEIID